MVAGSSARLHFLDWLRTLLVVAVVWAHIIFAGIGEWGDVVIDNSEFAKSLDPVKWGLAAEQNTIRIRLVSLCRPWTIPVLFWVSGASMALAFNFLPGRLCKAMKKMALLTIIGVGLNAAMWFLGPQDPMCSINHETWHNCKGILFNFTEDPNSGTMEPFTNQMWYTIILLVFMPISWPFFKVVSGNLDKRTMCQLGAQFLFMLTLFAGLIFAAGKEIEHPTMLLAFLLVCEILFLGLACLAGATATRQRYRISLRVVHYASALVAVFQLGAAPNAPKFDDMTMGFFVYLLTGVVRWFQLGFLMTRPRKNPEEDEVKPVASQFWPAVILAFCAIFPSTNWYLAGVLPYPYFPDVLDRTVYAAFTIAWFFVIDRFSRLMLCKPVPAVVKNATMVLYLGQIVLITLCFAMNLRTIEGIFGIVVLVSLVLGALMMLCQKHPRHERAKHEDLDDNLVSNCEAGKPYQAAVETQENA